MTEQRSISMADTNNDPPADDGLNWGQIGLGIVGLLVFAAAFTVASDLLTGVVDQLRSVVDNDYLLIMVIGGVALGVAVLVFLASRNSAQTMQPPDVERPVTAPDPGERLDVARNRWHHWVPFAGRQSRESIRDRLRNAAIVTITAQRDVNAADATARVDDGSWTTDAVAAAFLGADGDRLRPTLWLRAIIHGETPVGYRARRAMAAIEAIHAGREEAE